MGLAGLPLGQVHTRLPPAQIPGDLERVHTSFTPVISLVLPWALSDALSELKIWISAHIPPRMVSKLETLVANNRS